jgi:hypothetical protein
MANLIIQQFVELFKMFTPNVFVKWSILVPYFGSLTFKTWPGKPAILVNAETL